MRTTLFLSILAITLSPALARAADPAAAAKAARQGITLYQEGKYEDALERLSAAEAGPKNPVVTHFKAQCLEKLGRFAEAREAYEAAASMTLSDDAPDMHKKTQDKARADLADLDARLAVVVVEVKGGEPSDVKVRIDGSDQALSGVSTRILLTPGDHRVELTTPRRGLVTTTMTLVPKATTPLVLDGSPKDTRVVSDSPPPALRPEDPSRAKGSPPEPSRPATPREPTEGSTPALAYAAFGVGAAGLTVGGVAGLLAYTNASDVASRCDGARCLASDQGKANTASTLDTVSRVAFAVGAVGVGAGLAIIFLRDDSKEGTGQVGLYVGPGTVGVEGSM